MKNKTMTRRSLLTLGAAVLATSFAGFAGAQDTKPLRVILPLSAGSGVDVILRSTQVALSKALGGQAVVIENQPGAGGITGTQNLVKADPDGYTVAVISNNHSVNPSVFKSLPYDSLKDITAITVLGSSPFLLLVNPNKVSAKNAKELQALMKAKPGEFNYGSSGNGTIIHLADEMFLDEANVQARHIPYKGTGPMLIDMMGGQIELGVAAFAAAQGQVKSGALHPIGVMGKKRVSSLPDVPTIAEQGFPGVDIEGWFAVVGPKGLPPEQTKRLHDAFVTAFNDPDVKASFDMRDDVLILNSPQDATQFLHTEQARYAELVKKANLTVQ